MVCICTPLGVHPANFFPTQAGKDYELTPYLEVLKEFRKDFSVISGLAHPDVGSSHDSIFSFLTGAPHPEIRSGFRNSISLDQFAAEHIGTQTRFPNLSLSAEGFGLSWTRSGAYVPSDLYPANVFARMFLDGRPDEVQTQAQRLRDGQSILELGCGWGSLSLWMAERYPHARITAVSNSHGQRRHIEAQARERRLANLTVITCDANLFEPRERFNRIVSVEMFEHMANWDQLLGRARTWLAPDGRLFLHVFSSQTAPYRFAHEDPSDWIGKYFFTGGFMPSHDLIRDFGDIFTVEADWRWSGKEYEKTALDWLANMDRHDYAVRRLMRDVYGEDADLWRRRWRLFFLATAGLFGHRGGQAWGVSHYRLAPA